MIFLGGLIFAIEVVSIDAGEEDCFVLGEGLVGVLGAKSVLVCRGL